MSSYLPTYKLLDPKINVRYLKFYENNNNCCNTFTYTRTDTCTEQCDNQNESEVIVMGINEKTNNDEGVFLCANVPDMLIYTGNMFKYQSQSSSFNRSIGRILNCALSVSFIKRFNCC